MLFHQYCNDAFEMGTCKNISILKNVNDIVDADTCE